MSCWLQFCKKAIFGANFADKDVFGPFNTNFPIFVARSFKPRFFGQMSIFCQEKNHQFQSLWFCFEHFLKSCVDFSENEDLISNKKLHFDKIQLKTSPLTPLEPFLFWKEIIEKLYLENNFLLQHVSTFKLPFEIPYILLQNTFTKRHSNMQK